MKLSISASLVAMAMLSVLAGCTHQPSVDRKVNQELAAEPAVAAGGPLAMESRKLISESTELTQQQKDKLLALHATMAEEMRGMRLEEGKLKMVFFKTLLNPNAEESEITNLKTRIVVLDRKKTNRMLSAFEEAREILGKKSIQDEKLYRALSMDRIGEP